MDLDPQTKQTRIDLPLTPRPELARPLKPPLRFKLQVTPAGAQVVLHDLLGPEETASRGDSGSPAVSSDGNAPELAVHDLVGSASMLKGERRATASRSSSGNGIDNCEWTYSLRDGARYRLQITASGYEPHEESFRARRSPPWKIKLVPIRTLLLPLEYDAVIPFANGVRMQKQAGSPMWAYRLRPGERAVNFLVQADGYETGTLQVQVDETWSFPHMLPPVRLEPTLLPVRIHIHSAPAGGNLTVDGESKGRTPIETLLPPGEHVIEIRQDGFLPWRNLVLINAQTHELHAELEPDRTWKLDNTPSFIVRPIN
jgi:hypothetical protein